MKSTRLMTTKLVPLLVFSLVVILTLRSPSWAYAQDVEVPPYWRAGPVAVYILSFPGDDSTIHGTVTVQLAVWNVDIDEPIIIYLDGEKAATIIKEGMFTYSWKNLKGSHHLSIVSSIKIFDESTFWVKPPPPRPATVPLQKFLEELEKQRENIILYMGIAAACGPVTGIWMKKKTKIKTQWAFILPTFIIGVGYWRMPQLYMLIPFGITMATTYYLARDYADTLGLMRLRFHGVEVEEIDVDDEGKVIIGISPRYWRKGFILRKKIKIENEYPCQLIYEGVLKCIVVKKVTETEDEMKIECSRALAELLINEGALKEMNKMVEKVQARNTLLENSALAASWKMIREQTKEGLKAVLAGKKGKEYEPAAKSE